MKNRSASHRACEMFSHARYSSARLHVDSRTASASPRRSLSEAKASSMPRAAKSRRSRSSTGAVRWLTPSRSRCIEWRSSEVMAAREEIAHGQEIQQNDGESDGGEPGGAPATPAD